MQSPILDRPENVVFRGEIMRMRTHARAAKEENGDFIHRKGPALALQEASVGMTLTAVLGGGGVRLRSSMGCWQ